MKLVVLNFLMLVCSTIAKLISSPIVVLAFHRSGLRQRHVAVDLQQRPQLQKFGDGFVLEDEVERDQALEICPARPEVGHKGQGPAEVVGRGQRNAQW